MKLLLFIEVKLAKAVNLEGRENTHGATHVGYSIFTKDKVNLAEFNADISLSES